MPKTPEDEARERIDAQLAACGWQVQDRAAADITAATGVAISEFPLIGGDEADYLLYADGIRPHRGSADPLVNCLSALYPRNSENEQPFGRNPAGRAEAG